ncbi:MAG: PAS domain-containing protein [Tenericutes bacterium]|jgi:diguanylate cyclase (GGDEF)-like protein/PAS domain S-box-containing protein|nr:PAS domain-containing protein [Mycoplasmatota bacterium]
MEMNYYFNQITLTDILIGIIFSLLLIIIVLLIIYSYKGKLKKDFYQSDFSPLRILENLEGMAFNCAIDQHWTMNYVNSNAYKVIGYTNEEIINNNVISYNDIIHPKFRKYVRDKYDEAIRNHEGVNIEYKIISKSGEERWVAEEANIIFNRYGEPKFVDGLIYDINYRKGLLQKRNQYQLRYRSLIDGLDFPMIVIHENKIVEVNPAGINFFRANSKDDVIGHNPLEFIDKQYHDFYKKRMMRLKETKISNLPTNYKLKRLDNTDVYATVNAKPFFENGQLLSHVVLLEKDSRFSFNQQLKKTERRNRDLILYMHEGIGVFQLIPDEMDGKLVFANKRFSEFILGYERNLIYERFTQVFSEIKEEDLKSIFEYKDKKPIQKEVVDTENEKYYQILFYFNKENELVVQITDMTNEKLLIQKYYEEKEILDEILDATATMIWNWDLKNHKIIFDAKTYELLGYDKDKEEIANPKDIMSYFHPEDRDNVSKQINQYFNNKSPYFSIEVRIRDVKDEYRWWMIRGKVTKKNKIGKATWISGTYQDITHHKQKEEEIRFLSLHDQLTKLYNLRAYTSKMESLDHEENYPISLAIIDVNGLKVINDALNHSVGDELLVKTAGVLNEFIEEGDVIARIGGDEFAMIMPKTELNDADNRFKNIVKVLSNECVSNIPISISYGIDVKVNDKFTLYQIKDMADSKMYKQKFDGKDTRLQILEIIRDNFFEQNPFEKEVVEYVRKLSCDLAKYINVDRDELEKLEIASQYYNIGIFSISQDTFNDQREFGDLKEVEYKKHVENAYRIMLATYRNEEIARIILYHHEKYNGKGYPANLKGDEIPLLSRIISVTATYARKKLLDEKQTDIFKYIKSEKGVAFDPILADKFIEMIKNK